ncbi:MAG: TetR/AcrR family transcriptional regulator [Dehalococcoidia bacterium]|nr:TetR/AcrR family transcriptional regulator [Dehalococcoidia bacterium]
MKTHVNQATQERILQAAGDVFSQKGYHGANVDEIVRLSETSKGGIYFHFSSKEILFFAVMDGLASQLVGKVDRAVSREKTPLGKCEVALETVLMTLGNHKKLARLLLVQGYSMGKGFENKRRQIFSRFAGQIEGVLNQAVKSGDIPTLDSKLASYVWLGAISEVVMLWLQSPDARSPKEACPYMRDMLLRSVGFKVPAATRSN